MRLFGTDGVRAPFGSYPLDQPTVASLGRNIGEMLRERSATPVVVIGGDTRESTPQLVSWLTAGLESSATSALFGGVLPTPAVATLVGLTRADAGIAVSASHNPLPDNGIKIFDRNGFKASTEVEHQLEQRLSQPGGAIASSDPSPRADPALADAYLEQLKHLATTNSVDLTGFRVVLDLGNGAASPFGAGVFKDLGADVIALSDSPDGTNINLDCGSTAPEHMATRVVETGADMGIAFDGDADRAIFADEHGQLRDGDAVLYLWARALRKADALDPPAIVATTMSNLGLEVALRADKIRVVRCAVGDRTVVHTMQSEGVCLGGEQSGHIVHLGLTTTGDGLVTAIQLAGICRQASLPLSELLQDFHRVPQVLKNIRVSRKPDLQSLPAVREMAQLVEDDLGDQGRLVLRYSGTEPLARVMIEGPDEEIINVLADKLIETIRAEIGAD